jgi:lambda family phage tail tape measure protein
LQNIENMNKALEAQLKIQEALTGARLSIISQGQDIAFEGSQIGQGELQKQMMNIGETNRKAALEASRAFAASFEDGGDGLTSAQAQQLATGLDTIANGYKGISEAQLANLEASRTWEAGWSEAFANYRDSAQNAAESAKTSFTVFTTGVEDAFVNMFKSGDVSFKNLKKGFKDLANSMIADFIRIEAKKAILGLFGMFAGSSTLAGAAVTGLPGYANGGSIPAKQLSIVGERGPELFMPKNAGTIIPNNMLGGGQTNNTAVTYNIQAVDASSFRSMLARDPEFIHNVAEQGRRQMPIRSRR